MPPRTHHRRPSPGTMSPCRNHPGRGCTPLLHEEALSPASGSGWACKRPRWRSRRTTGTGSGLWKVPGGRGNLPADAAHTATKPGAGPPASCLGVRPDGWKTIEKLCPRRPASGWACKRPRRRSRRTTGTGSGPLKVPGGRGNLPADAAHTATKPGADPAASSLGAGPGRWATIRKLARRPAPVGPASARGGGPAGRRGPVQVP